jgi:3-(3-hydroxy-phenyl)propionate hydroxylase
MRPAGRDETDSLYFTYPHFNEPRGEARAHLGDAVPVVIVGAGPVGMVAALSLAREGVRSVLVEARSSFNDGSRAICIARQSFHILESLGALEPFLTKALGWTTGTQFLPRQADTRIHECRTGHRKNSGRCTISSSNTSRSISIRPSPPIR